MRRARKEGTMATSGLDPRGDSAIKDEVVVLVGPGLVGVGSSSSKRRIVEGGAALLLWGAGADGGL